MFYISKQATKATKTKHYNKNTVKNKKLQTQRYKIYEIRNLWWHPNNVKPKEHSFEHIKCKVFIVNSQILHINHNVTKLDVFAVRLHLYNFGNLFRFAFPVIYLLWFYLFTCSKQFCYYRVLVSKNMPNLISCQPVCIYYNRDKLWTDAAAFIKRR